MKLQTGTGTLRRPGERRSTMSTPAKTIPACLESLVTSPDSVDALRIGMTRHTSPTARRPAHRDAGTLSGALLQADRERNPLTHADSEKLPLPPCPPGSAGMLAPPIAVGCKMALSGGLLYPAFRSPGIQNVLFAGVFVPRLWNTTCHQSASRNPPVGVRYRLYHGVPGLHTAFHFTCRLLYTSMASPKASKLPCHERRGARCPTLGALPNPPATARLECVQEVATQLSADRAQMRTAVPGRRVHS